MMAHIFWVCLSAFCILTGGSGPALADEAAQQALDALDKAMETTVSEADPAFNQAMRDYCLGRCDKAASELLRAADAGNPVAQNTLGNMHVTGCSVRKDPEAAKAWYSKAVAQGYSPAMFNLARALLRANAADSRAKALELLNKAVDAGNVAAELFLAQLYLEGDGVPVDKIKGMALLDKGVAAKSAMAMTMRARQYLESRDMPDNQGKGLALLREAAQLGSAPAFYSLGMCSEQGIGGKPDPVMAFAYYNTAKKLGDSESTKALDRISETMSWQQLIEARRIN